MQITKITKKCELNNNTINNVLFFHIAEGGACGAPGDVIILTKQGKAYNLNYLIGEITYNDVVEFFPPLKNFSSFMGNELSLPIGWQYVYTGLGNHLLISDEIYEKFYNEIKDIKPEYKIYGAWIEKAQKLLCN